LINSFTKPLVLSRAKLMHQIAPNESIKSRKITTILGMSRIRSRYCEYQKDRKNSANTKIAKAKSVVYLKNELIKFSFRTRCLLSTGSSPTII